MYICNAQQARQEDENATKLYHIPSLILMEHAAQVCTEHILQTKKHNIVIVAGPGNNGGDGLAIARLLYQKGVRPFIYLPGTSMSESENVQFEILQALNYPIHTNYQEFLMALDKADLIVDALFGNGLSRPIEGQWKAIIQAINETNVQTISIDIASGLDATTGEILGCAIQADQTYALDCLKEGHLVGDGLRISGKLQCFDIGIPHKNLKAPVFIDANNAKLPLRSDFSHKGTFGKALMIGGSQAMHGAITMAAKACYKSGIGTLTLCIPDCIADILAYKMDSAMRLVCPSQDGKFSKAILNIFLDNVAQYDVISIGNGLGRNAITKELLKLALQSNKPLILDADAFWALQDQSELLKRSAPTILTPHVKELSYILSMDVKTIAAQPIQAAKAFSRAYPNCTLVLKSSISVVSKGERCAILASPNSALAKGGSGDILCGILTGLYGQSGDDFQAAMSACFIHSECAKQNLDSACFQPEDLLEAIPRVFQTLRKTQLVD